jgi:uncharacterized protein
MAEQENVRLVREIYAAFGRGDIPTALAALAEDVEWWEPGPTDILPWAGLRSGRDGVARFFRVLDDTEEIEQFEPQEFIAQGDRVVVLGHERCRIKSTGRNYDNQWAMVFTLREGKVAGFRAYHDTAAIAAAFRSG